MRAQQLNLVDKNRDGSVVHMKVAINKLSRAQPLLAFLECRDQ
jgi:hypothetical protein